MYVVTEVLRTEKETEATLMRKQEGSGQFTLPGALGLQVWWWRGQQAWDGCRWGQRALGLRVWDAGALGLQV